MEKELQVKTSALSTLEKHVWQQHPLREREARNRNRGQSGEGHTLVMKSESQAKTDALPASASLSSFLSSPLAFSLLCQLGTMTIALDEARAELRVFFFFLLSSPLLAIVLLLLFSLSSVSFLFLSLCLPLQLETMTTAFDEAKSEVKELKKKLSAQDYSIRELLRENNQLRSERRKWMTR